MNALSTKVKEKWPLAKEIEEYLAPIQPESRERIAKIALEKMEGIASPDLAVRVTEAVEAAILEEFHKGVDKRLRSYML